jgi:hypothetical protein
LLAFGFIVDTSFGFNRGDPHRSVRYQSPVLQSIESSAVNFCQCLYICSFNFLSLWVCVAVLNPRCPRLALISMTTEDSLDGFFHVQVGVWIGLRR